MDAASNASRTAREKMVIRLSTAVLLFVILGIFPIASSAEPEPAELVLVDVDPQRVERIRAYNGNEFERTAYFAKRWRVVEIDPQVLFQHNVVRIRPFPDVDLVVRRRPGPVEREADPNWLGVVESPAASAHARERKAMELDTLFERHPGLREQEQGIRHQSSVGATFTMGLWSVDEATGIADGSGFVPIPRLTQAGPSRDMQTEQASCAEPSHAVRGSTFISLIGSVTDPVNRARYVIEGLSRSPRYHIVYEFDSAAHVRGFPTGPERDRAQQRVLEFQASLPPDPPIPPPIRGEIE
ncbi:MAG: hypothetical protein JJU27_18370 [Gammaproteobacteria bacterium]|nr:hypothetical protein [Gammaproteobacteria bacterium]